MGIGPEEDIVEIRLDVDVGRQDAGTSAGEVLNAVGAGPARGLSESRSFTRPISCKTI